MTVHLDTSVLIDVLTRTRPLLGTYASVTAAGHRIGVSAIVLYEWLRGPRTGVEIELQQQLCPEDGVVIFGPAEAAVAASLYRRLTSSPGREADIAIAACAIEHNAAIWTLNPRDFRDIPGLKLYNSRR